jgi:hypothetical protein
MIDTSTTKHLKLKLNKKYLAKDVFIGNSARPYYFYVSIDEITIQFFISLSFKKLQKKSFVGSYYLTTISTL